MKDLVILKNRQALTTSRMVADCFEKRHDLVVRDIRSLIQQMASVSQPSKLGDGVNKPTSQIPPVVYHGKILNRIKSKVSR